MAETRKLFGPTSASASGVWTDVSDLRPSKTLYMEALESGASAQIRAANGPKPSTSASGSVLVTLAGDGNPAFPAPTLIQQHFDWIIFNKTGVGASPVSTICYLAGEQQRDG